MSQVGIDSIQSWLSFELEQHGIDSVIYTRHVLDLFLNSRYTTDLHLAKKEASIFASLPPGSKKRKPKQKYTRRSNSFTYYDDIALKKQMAANCLRSASDDVTDNIRNGNSIEILIEKLYFKLNNLHLLSDTSSSSDEAYVGKRVEKRHEEYHDAFPSLTKKLDSKIKTTRVASVWNGHKKFGPKIAAASNAVESKPVGETRKDQNTQTCDKRKKHRPSKGGSSTQDDSSFIVRGGVKQQPRGIERPRKGGRPRHITKRKPHSSLDVVTKPPSCYKRKNNDAGKRFGREQHDHDKENTNEIKPRFNRKIERNKRKFGGNSMQYASAQQSRFKSFFDNVGATVADQSSYDVVNLNGFPRFLHDSFGRSWKTTSVNEVNEKEISHLYSAGIEDIFHDDKTQSAPCSKWFRDPQSGCLEFEPAYKSRASNDMSPSSQDEVASHAEADHDEASESWLWCPSPSLWEDDDNLSPGGALSRLETIYRPLAKAHHQEHKASQFWKDYQAIFDGISEESSLDNEKATKFESDSDQFEDVACIPLSLELDDYDEKEKYDLNGNYLAQAPHEEYKRTTILPESFEIKDHGGEIPDVLKLKMPDSCYELFKNTTKINSACESKVWNETKMISSDVGHDVTAQSRKGIWLQHSKQFTIDDELNMLLTGGNMSPGSYMNSQKKSSFSNGFSDFHFANFNANPLDDFFSGFPWSMFGATELQWMLDWNLPDKGWGKCNYLADESQILCQNNGNDDLNVDDEYYMATLVQSVVDVVTFSEDQVFEDDLNTFLGIDCCDGSSPDSKLLKSDELLSDSEFPVFSRNASQDFSAQSHTKHDSTNSNTSLLAECVTENEAWKTSLRIGNVWQAIAGIRPVDIVYSEKQVESDASVLQPSSLTHFRPIHASEQDSSDVSNGSSYKDNFSSQPVEIFQPITDEYIEYSSSLSPQKRIKKCEGCSGCDMKLRGLELEIGNLLYGDGSQVDVHPGCQKFRPKFRKLGEDKSMQTSFEQHIRRIDSDMCKSLSVRPPKANSR